MICFRRSERGGFAAAFALLALAMAAAGAEPAAPPDARALFAAFSGVEAFEARFEETKEMALLAAPLVSRGRLYFTRPGLLARHVEEPSPSRVLITPDLLTFSDASGERRMDLHARPDVKLFVESFVRVLMGDEATLARVYRIGYERDGASWRLVLEPKGEELAHIVQRMVLSGQGLAVEEIRVEDAAGDVTVTQLSEVDTERRFDPEERAELFSESAR